MDINVKFQYTKDWIPPRCRKPRPGRFDSEVTVTLKEVKATEAPWACIVYAHRRYYFEYPVNPIRFYDGHFYERAMTDMRVDRSHMMTDSYGKHVYWADYDDNRPYQRRGMRIDEVIDKISRCHDDYVEGISSPYFAGKSEEENASDIKWWADRYLIVNGEVWEKVGEPRYVVQTFGLGHNHGGTAWFCTYGYNQNISKDAYFNANEFERMVEHYFDVALGRGDTEDAHRYAKDLADGNYDHIKVLMPEVFTCNPQREHGDGDPFMNMLEGLTSSAGSAFEAGLLCMAATAAEVA